MTAEEPEEYVSVDDIDGQLEYATALGDLMVDLVQTLEQSLSQGGETAFSQLRLSQSEGLHLIEMEWDEAAVQLCLRRDDYVSANDLSLIEGHSAGDGNNQWLVLSSLGLVARFVRQILRIPHLSPQGSAQLAVDISYVMNIMSAIGVPVSLLTILILLEISKDELSERADEVDRASAPRRNQSKDNKQTGSDKRQAPPRELVRSIAKKRGILTSF